jgi:hypothetical protein
MRNLIKFSRNENTIAMQVYDKINKKSSNFYLLKSKIQDVLDGKEMIDRDIWSYCSIWKRENAMNFRVDWLEGAGGFKLEGYTQNFTISTSKFIEWYESEEEKYTCISINENKTAKFDVRCEKNLHEVINNKILKKKFTKGIQKLMCWQGETIELYDDWAEHSFYFVEKDKNNQRVMNGGMIFHHDYDEKDNLKKGYYGIHT